MAWNIRERKTEHAGAKHASNKERRSNDRWAVASEVELPNAAADSTIDQ